MGAGDLPVREDYSKKKEEGVCMCGCVGVGVLYIHKRPAAPRLLRLLLSVGIDFTWTQRRRAIGALGARAPPEISEINFFMILLNHIMTLKL